MPHRLQTTISDALWVAIQERARRFVHELPRRAGGAVQASVDVGAGGTVQASVDVGADVTEGSDPVVTCSAPSVCRDPHACDKGV